MTDDESEQPIEPIEDKISAPREWVMRPLNEEEGDPDEQRLAQITARIEKIRARMAERRQIEEVQRRQTEGLQKGEVETKRLALLTAMAIQKERLQKKRKDREERLFAICGIVLVCALFAWAWWLSQ